MIAQKKVEPAVTLKTRNVVELFQERVRASGNRRAAMYKVAGTWKDISWNELSERTRRLGAALINHGVQPGDRVVIFASTRLEWVIAHFANLSVGAVTVPIYASNTVDECAYIVRDAGAKLAFVDNDATEKGAAGRLTRLLEVQKKNPALASLIAFDKGALAGKAGVFALDDLEKEGQAQLDKVATTLDQRIADVHPDSPATIIYTSGTTGNPKGVVLTHRSWVYEGQVVGEIGIMVPDELVLLFLPLAHSFGIVIVSSWLGLGFSMAFCDNVDRLIEYAGEVRPTVLPAVPRIFEKVYAAVVQKAMAQPGIKGKLVHWAFREFDKYAAAREAGKDYTALSFQLAKALVFKKMGQQVKDRVGGNIRLFVSGSAPLAKKIAYFFDINGIMILEGYGLTETSAGSVINRPDNNKIGTVGCVFPGTELKIAEDGEILIRGPGVMNGYFNNPEATKECLTDDGWLKTGDIGELDGEGYLKITDRKKDLIKTSGGKYVAPQNLENALKTSPIISQVMIHGDRRKFISALVTISEDEGKKVLKEKGVPYTTYPEMTQRPEVRADVQKAFDALNATLPSYETVKKFAILETDFTLESGDLTPTLKVKRKVATQKYIKVLDSFYDDASD